MTSCLTLLLCMHMYTVLTYRCVDRLSVLAKVDKPHANEGRCLYNDDERITAQRINSLYVS
jgi:hypothetical protein